MTSVFYYLGAVVVILGAVEMSPFFGTTRARAILIEHGFDPNADVEVLIKALEARGWHVRISREPPGRQAGFQPRCWAQAVRRTPSEDLDDLVLHSATGGTPRAVMVVVLAKVLTQEPGA